MRVRATDLGYYGNRRQREGRVFTLTDPKHFSEKWMEKLDQSGSKSGKKASGKASKIEHEAPPDDLYPDDDESGEGSTGDQEVI